MSSWFQSSALSSAFDSLSETVQSVTDSVQDAIPAEHKALLAKLTLNTDEMISERQNFRDEESRKSAAKDRLNKILPWETLDAEREILVEECKDAILELSGNVETFFGPFEMPLLNVQLQEAEEFEEEGLGDQHESEEPAEGKEIDPSGDDDGDKVKANFVGEENRTTEKEKGEHRVPSEESREMLAKLEPLPSLLEDFDLDEHVGLIQKILKEDPKLVDMQAFLSGGGDRERTFWRNYFFHCAFTRYECGLSIDEIWSYQEESNITNESENASTEYDDADVASTTVASMNEEDTIIFDGTDADNVTTTADTTCDENVDGAGTTDASLAALSEGSPGNDFELVDEDLNEGSGDPELDELEAEIARELEN